LIDRDLEGVIGVAEDVIAERSEVFPTVACGTVAGPDGVGEEFDHLAHRVPAFLMVCMILPVVC